jgi:hypothetical protein
MDVVAHQHIRVEFDFVLPAHLTEIVKVKLVIVFCEETGTRVVTPLYEVHGNSCELEPRSSGHAGSNPYYRLMQA